MRSLRSKKILLGILVVICFIFGGIFIGSKAIGNTYALELDHSSDWYGFTGIYIPKDSAAMPGEKVNVELYADASKWTHISLGFRSTSSNNTFIVYLKNINTKNINNPAYFVMPSLDGAQDGEVYELRSVHLFGDNFSKSYYTYQVDNNPFMNPGEKKYVTYNSEKKNETVDEMSLSKFEFINNNFSLGEKVYVDLDYTSSKKIDSCSLWFKNIDYGNVLYYALSDFDKEPYFLLENNSVGTVISGEYMVTGMTCFYDEGGNIYFTGDKSNDSAIYYDFGEKLVVKEEVNNSYSDFKLFDFQLLDSEVSFGDTVNVNLVTNINEESVLLSFYNEDTNDVLPVYLKGMEKRYFVIPSTVVAGEYKLQYILIKNFEHSYTLLDNNGVIELYQDGILTKNEIDIKFDKMLKIVDNSSSSSDNNRTYLFNNEDYNEKVKNEIMNLEEDAVITVISDNNTLISKGLFEAIRETRRTLIINYKESEWIFSGADIEEVKDVDVALIISDITSSNFEDSFVSKLPKKSKLLTFSNNGKLPGKVLIRLKSVELDDLFGEDNLYIYYYQKGEGNLDKVAMEIQKSYGYYEFYINHNSDYILTSSVIDKDIVSDNDEILMLNSSYDVDVNNKNNVVYYVVIAVVVVVVCVLSLLFFFHKKESSKFF